MSATDKHQEFTKKLTDLIMGFNEENPDLYVSDIDIATNTYQDGRKRFGGVRVMILAQPAKWE